MAKLNIFPAKKFELILDDKTVITGKYGTWAGMRFCRKRGVKLSQLSDYLNKSINEEDYEVIADYVLSAVEQVFDEKGGSNFPYTAANMFAWMDELGWEKLGLLLNPNEEQEEKKSQEDSTLNGTISSASQEVAA